MAEWVPKPPPPPPPPPSPPPPPPPPPVHETYIIQVPKDQIYRVPPPENAYLAERYRKIPGGRRRNCSCCACLTWLLGIVVLLLLLAAVFYLAVKPKLPRFAVEHVVAVNSTRRHHHHHHRDSRPRPDYDVTMKTANPSAGMGFVYEKGGSAVLSYKNHHIAGSAGNAPGFRQGYGREATTTRTFKLVLAGSDDVNLPPREVERSVKGGKRTDGGLGLSLSIHLPVKLRIGGLRSWVMAMEVGCDVRVSSLVKKETRVLYQHCRVKLQP